MAKKSRIGLVHEGIGLLTVAIKLLSAIVELVNKVVSYARRHSELPPQLPTQG